MVCECDTEFFRSENNSSLGKAKSGWRKVREPESVSATASSYTKRTYHVMVSTTLCAGAFNTLLPLAGSKAGESQKWIARGKLESALVSRKGWRNVGALVRYHHVRVSE